MPAPLSTHISPNNRVFDQFDFSFVYQLPIKSLSGIEAIPDCALRKSPQAPQRLSPHKGFPATRSSYCSTVQAKRQEVEFVKTVFREVVDAASRAPLFPSPSSKRQSGRHPQYVAHLDQPMSPTDTDTMGGGLDAGDYQWLSSDNDMDADSVPMLPNQIDSKGRSDIGDQHDDSSHLQWTGPTMRDQAMHAAPVSGLRFEDSTPSLVGSNTSDDGVSMVRFDGSSVHTASTSLRIASLSPLMTPNVSHMHKSDNRAAGHSIRKTRTSMDLGDKVLEQQSRLPPYGATTDAKLWTSEKWIANLDKLTASSKNSSSKANNALSLQSCMQVSGILCGEASIPRTDEHTRDDKESKSNIVVTPVRSRSFKINIPHPLGDDIHDEKCGGDASPAESPVGWVSHTARWRYEVFPLQILGSGAFCTVFSCKRTAAESAVNDVGEAESLAVAVKVPNPREGENAQLTLERELFMLQHLAEAGAPTESTSEQDMVQSALGAGVQHIVKLLGIFSNDRAVLHLVLPCYTGMNMREFLQLPQHAHGLQFFTFIAIVRQLLDALAYLHESARIVHADIKPENIMWKQPFGVEHDPNAEASIVLLDFGNAFFIDEASALNTQMSDGNYSSRGYLQSRHYRAPEVIQKQHYGMCACHLLIPQLIHCCRA